MGTRADFYIGKGSAAEWLGSVAWDGYEWENTGNPVFDAKTPDDFRNAVMSALKSRDDATYPSDGWPWPWDDSNTTDYAYMFDDGKVIVYVFGKELFVNAEGEHDTHDDKHAEFPNMKDKKNVQWSGNKSGLIVIGG